MVLRHYIKSGKDAKLNAVNKLKPKLGYGYIGHWFVLTQIGRNATAYNFRKFLDEVVRKEYNDGKNNGKTQITGDENEPLKVHGSKSSASDYHQTKGDDVEMGNMSGLVNMASNVI